LSAFELEFYSPAGRRRLPLGEAWSVRFEGTEPVRRFRWAKGGENFPGRRFAATTADHVGYESWPERDRLILLDRDPAVVGIASQPFRLYWCDGREARRHAPDHFVRLADGGARGGRCPLRRPPGRADRGGLRGRGLEFERADAPEPVFMANVRWPARYRRRRSGRPAGVVSRLIEVFVEPLPLWTRPSKPATGCGFFRCCSTSGRAVAGVVRGRGLRGRVDTPMRMPLPPASGPRRPNGPLPGTE
jgi:hypothetical protein